MYTLGHNTSKDEIIQYLRSVAKSPGSLEVEVEDIPTCLENDMSFNIFLQQLSNYPRRILWRTSNPDSYAFLAKTSLNRTNLFYFLKKNTEKVVTSSLASVPLVDPIKEIQVKEQVIPSIDFEQEIKAVLQVGEIVESVNEIVTEEQKTLTFKQRLERTKQLGYAANQATLALEKPEQEQVKKEVNTPAFATINEDEEVEKWLRHISKAKQQIETKKETILERKNKNFISLIKNIKLPEFKKKEVGVRTTYTSSTLQLALKRKDFQPSFKSRFDKITSTRIKKNWNLYSRRFAIASLGFFVFASVVSLASNLFNTQDVYTVEVSLNKKVINSEVSVLKSDFTKVPFSTTVESSITTTGTTGVSSDEISGTISLKNTSGQSVNLTNGGLYFISGSTKMKAEDNPSIPATFKLPGNNTDNEFTFAVSLPASSGFSLPAGSPVKVTNLAGVAISNNITGTVVEDIGLKTSKKKVVKADMDALKTLNTSKLDLAIQDKLVELSKNDQNSLRNISLKTIDSVKDISSSKLEDVTDTATSKQEYSVSLLTLNSKKLEEILKSKVESFEKFDSAKYLGLMGGLEGEKITISLSITYFEKLDISEEILQKILSQKDASLSNELILRAAYPNIKNVKIENKSPIKLNKKPIINVIEVGN
jgi:hypothetical protein